MTFNLDFFGNLLLQALVTAERPVGIQLLQSIHDKDVDEYEAIIYVAKYLIKKGDALAAKTTTTLDDNGLAALQGLITDSAAQNGITLKF